MPRMRGGRARLLLTGALSAAAALCAIAPPAAVARDASVPSFDGTPIVTHFFPAQGLAPGAKAPTILVGHGWAGRGATDIDGGTDEGTQGNTAIGDLHRAGYNVLTWDARGFGGSGGIVNVDGPDYEGRDVRRLISHVADQPEATLDSAGDPRVGMAGGSYGGGIQLVTAALDTRLDAIVPDIAWHSLVTSLYKDDNIKLGWGSVLASAGNATGRLDGRINSAFTQGAATGRIGDNERNWFASRGPGAELVGKIRIPTLLTQGTVDTLFTLREAEANYRILKANKVPVKMMWHCGGHGLCDFPPGEPGRVERAALKWFDRYLKGNKAVDTGAGFEWVDDQGAWHTSASYPLTPHAPLTGASAGGTLPLSPSLTTGSPIEATSGSPNVELAIAAPKGAESLVGSPELTLTYSGTASQAQTAVFAQVVDKKSGQVLGNQATPIPVTLDGATRTVSRPLESIAAQAGPSSRLVVQIVPASLIYGQQRATGSVTIASAKASLPTGEPVRAGASLSFRKVGRTRAASVRKRSRTMRFRLCASGGRVRSIAVAVKRGRRVVARSRRFNVNAGTCRKPKVRRFRSARKGAYTVVAAGRDASGRRLRTTKKFRLR